jgi:hypothetical protein
MLNKQLSSLGLGKNEIKVYLALFDLGKTKATEIINYTKLHRQLVYSALQDLETKQLIAKTEGGKVAQFEINDPKQLENLAEQKKLIATEAARELRKKLSDKPRDIYVYDGVEGIKANREKIAREIKPGENYYLLGISSNTTTPELDAYWPKFNSRIHKKGANIFALATGGSSEKMLTNRGFTPGLNAKYLPFSADAPMWMSSFGEYFNVSIADDHPVTFSIRSKQAAEGFKKYFEFFWNQKVHMKQGISAVKEVLYSMLNELTPDEHYLVLGTLGKKYPKGFSDLYDEFHKARIKKGVTVKMLCYQESYNGIKDRFSYAGDPEGKISLLKKYTNTTPIPMQINVHKQKVFFIIYEDNPTVITFDNPAIAASFRNNFNNIWDQDTYTLRGAKALQEIWLEAVDHRELRFIGARGYFMDKHPELYKPIEAKAKKTPGVVWRNIVDKNTQGHPLTKLPWSETKYNLPNIKNPNVVWLFGKKVAISNWAEGDEPVIFVSENKNLVQSYNDYFEALWKL